MALVTILDALTTGARLDAPVDRVAEAVTARHWRPDLGHALFERAMGSKTAGAKHAVRAEVNHGRWIVVCPDCLGAQLTAESDPRFLCDNCANASIDHRWRPVTWPADRDAIEAELSTRLGLDQRSWRHPETVDDLRAEAAMHSPAGLVVSSASASAHEGHTHDWPKRATDGLKSCAGCGLTLPAADTKGGE